MATSVIPGATSADVGRGYFDYHDHPHKDDSSDTRAIDCDFDTSRSDDGSDFKSPNFRDSYASGPGDVDTGSYLRRYRYRAHFSPDSTSITTPSLRSGASTSTSASLRSPSLSDAFTSGEVPSLTDVNTCINAFSGRFSGAGGGCSGDDIDEHCGAMEEYGFCKPQRYIYNAVTVDSLLRSIFEWVETPSIIDPEQQKNFDHYDALELVFKLCTGRFLVWIQLQDTRALYSLTSKVRTITAHLEKLSTSRARINSNEMDEHELQPEFQRFQNEIQEFLLFLKVYNMMAIPYTAWPVFASRLLGNKGMRVKKMSFLRLLGAHEVQEFVDADIISYLAMVAPLLWLNDENYETPIIMSVADGIIELDIENAGIHGDRGFDIFNNDSNGAYGGLSLRDRSTVIPDDKSQSNVEESRRASTFLKRLEMHRDPGKFGILPLAGFCKASGGIGAVNPVYSIGAQPLDDMTLAEHLRASRPLDVVKRVSLALGLAKTVLHLHLVGWTHGNLSPENILLPWGFRAHRGIPQPYFKGLRVGSPWHRRSPVANIVQEHFGEGGGLAVDIEALGWLLLEVYIWRELKPELRSTVKIAEWSGNLIVQEKFAAAFYSCVNGLAAHEGLITPKKPGLSRLGLYWRVVRPLEECLDILEGRLMPFWEVNVVDWIDLRYQENAILTLDRAIEAIGVVCEGPNTPEPSSISKKSPQDGQLGGPLPGIMEDSIGAHCGAGTGVTRQASLTRRSSRKQKQVRVISPQDFIPGKARSPLKARFNLFSRIIPEKLDAMLSKSPIQEPETICARNTSENPIPTSPPSAGAPASSDTEAWEQTPPASTPPLPQPSQSPMITSLRETGEFPEEDQQPTTSPTNRVEKRMVYVVQCSPEVIQAWHTSILPCLESLLQRLSTTKWPIGPTSIDLLGIGTSRETSRPTIVITCSSSSTSLVRAYLKKKFTYDTEIFDLKVRKGSIRRSSARRCRRYPRRSHAASQYSRSITANRGYQQKPSSGASIGVCRNGEDLPPGTFGGVIVVDGKLYGMTVHHLLDPLTEEDFEDDEETDILEDIEALRLSADWSGGEGTEMELEWKSDEDDEGYDDDMLSETSSLEGETLADQDDTSDDESISTTGDLPGLEPNHTEKVSITQPAILDLPEDCAIFIDESSREKYKLGTILASSGLRRTLKNGTKHEVDWALVEVEPKRLEHRNTIRGGAKYCSLGYGQECEDLHPNGIVPMTELGVTRVHASGRTTGLQTGEMSRCMGSLMLPGRASWSRSWHVIGNLGIPGDSGSWVIENAQGRVVGVVIARDGSNNFTYIAPMELLIDDIKETLGAREVGLPPRHLKREHALEKPKPPASSNNISRIADVISRSIVRGELGSVAVAGQAPDDKPIPPPRDAVPSFC